MKKLSIIKSINNLTHMKNINNLSLVKSVIEHVMRTRMLRRPIVFPFVVAPVFVVTS